MKGKHHGHDLHHHAHKDHELGHTAEALKHHKKKRAKGGAIGGVKVMPSIAKRKRGGKVEGELDTHKMAGKEGSPMHPLSGADVKEMDVEHNTIPQEDTGGKGGMKKRARGGRMHKEHEKKEHEHRP